MQKYIEQIYYEKYTNIQSKMDYLSDETNLYLYSLYYNISIKI